MRIGFFTCLILVCLSFPSFAQTGKIMGTLMDENGETMPGVSVYLEGDGKNEHTNLDGEFLYQLKPGTYTLVFKFVSYKEKTISGIVVKENEITTVSFNLTPKDDEVLTETTSLSNYQPDENPTLNLTKKKNPVFQNAVTQTHVKKLPNDNITDALYKITGSTIWLALAENLNFYNFDTLTNE